MTDSGKPLLEVTNVSKTFDLSSGRLGRQKGKIKALDGVSFSVPPGQTLGIVGESGCGKSTLGKIILRLLHADSGCVKFDGTDVLRATKKQLRMLREQMQIVFQDPYASLNSRMTVRTIIEEPLIIAGRPYSTERLMELIQQVGLSRGDLNRFPNEFSGGQRQRICIARAIALNPKLLICDEPVSALDVSVQSQILNLFNQLKLELGLTYLFISHDLSVVRHVSDRICVMYLGTMVESGPTEEIYRAPAHPYTQCLLSSVLEPVPNLRRLDQTATPLALTTRHTDHSGCPFYTRCPEAKQICRSCKPAVSEVTPGHIVCCHRYCHQELLSTDG